MTIDLTTGIAVAVVLSSLVTFVGTKLWDAYRMERKFRTIASAEKCMVERKKKEEEITKRLILGNLILADLAEKAGITDKVKQYEKALQIKVNDDTE